LRRSLTRKQLLGWVGKVSAGVLAYSTVPDWSASYATGRRSNPETSARFVWPTTRGDLDGIQTFRASVRKRGKGGDPTARVELHVAGVHRATVVPDTLVRHTSGEYLEGTWDATALAVTASAGVEMVVVAKGARGGLVEIADWDNTTAPHQWVTR
jgi:hypothetical protein